MTIKKDITNTISSIAANGTIPLQNSSNSVALPIPAVLTLPAYINNEQPLYQWPYQFVTQPSAYPIIPAHPLSNTSNMPPTQHQILPQPPTIPDTSRPQQTNAVPRKEQQQATPAIPNLRIDDLGKGLNAWLEAIHQWNKAASLSVAPLKSWQPHWYQGDTVSPYFASKKSQRKTIAEEYARWAVVPSYCIPSWPF